jgi:hypothetical protein
MTAPIPFNFDGVEIGAVMIAHLFLMKENHDVRD